MWEGAKEGTRGHGTYLQVPLKLHEHVLTASPQEDGAGLGVGALLQEHEVLLAVLADLKQAAASAYIGSSELLRPGHDGCTAATCNTQVVGLPHSPDGTDARLDEEMGGKVRHACRHMQGEGGREGAGSEKEACVSCMHACEATHPSP